MPRHIESLDGLRAIAVLLVLWCHIPVHVPGYPEWLGIARFLIEPGQLGVELFFALSGFLITRILLAERAQGTPVRWFLLRRLLRIFPIYYLLLLVMLPFRPAAEIGWCALYLSNVRSMLGVNSGPLEHTWSLCVEEHFYLLWPLVVATLPRHASRRLLTFVVIPTVLLAGLAVSQWCEPELAARILSRASPFRFVTLTAGALIAYAEPWLAAERRRAGGIGAMLVALGVLLHPKLVIVLPMWLGHAPWVPLRYAGVYAMVHIAVICAGIVVLCLRPPARAWSPRRLLEASWLRAIGRISYGLYLYHLPIYHAIVHPSPTPRSAALVVLLSLAVATASYLLIERPILRFAQRFRGR